MRRDANVRASISRSSTKALVRSAIASTPPNLTLSRFR